MAEGKPHSYKSTSADYLAYLGVDKAQRSLAYVFFNDVHFFFFPGWLVLTSSRCHYDVETHASKVRFKELT